MATGVKMVNLYSSKMTFLHSSSPQKLIIDDILNLSETSRGFYYFNGLKTFFEVLDHGLSNGTLG